MGYARKVDRNHGQIREALRAAGWVVLDTSALPEFVDLVACRRGRVEFVEVKDRLGKLTAAQTKLHADLARAGVSVRVVRTIDEAVRL